MAPESPSAPPGPPPNAEPDRGAAGPAPDPRTRARAAREGIARGGGPGARLVVLEATAPRPGPIAPLHALYLGRLVPLAGRLSPDPSAYAYLSRSIVEFGSGPEFERDLAATGFEVVG